MQRWRTKNHKNTVRVYDYLTHILQKTIFLPDDKAPTENEISESISKSAEPQSDVHLENWLKTCAYRVQGGGTYLSLPATG